MNSVGPQFASCELGTHVRNPDAESLSAVLVLRHPAMAVFLAERDQRPEVSLPALLQIVSEPVMFLPVKTQRRELPDAVGAQLALAMKTALLRQPLPQRREAAHMRMAVRPMVSREPVILPLPANLTRLPLQADP